MILENFTKEELIEKVKSHCAQMKMDYKDLKSGEYYYVDQDKDYVYLYSDDHSVEYIMNYDEAKKVLV